MLCHLQVHAVGGSNLYFFETNESISSDANVNVDGVMRALKQHIGDRPLPPTLFIYSDQGEKCMTLLVAFGDLVRKGCVDNLYYNQLVVNHTHEDIDSTFGKGSQYLRALGQVLSPSGWYQAMASAFKSYTSSVRCPSLSLQPAPPQPPPPPGLPPGLPPP